MESIVAHLILPIVGAKVTNNHNQVPYHSLHFLVVALSHFRTAVVQENSHDVEELECQALIAEDFLKDKFEKNF
jgi:hypothetical protein